MRSNRTQYAKYHEKMHRLVKKVENEGLGLFEDCNFDAYADYFSKTVAKETTFPLYRYCSLYHEGSFSLDLDILRLSCNGKMNDVFEGLAPSWHDAVSAEEYISKVTNLCYLKCFTETCTNNLMWAHYGDGFCGVCIEYDIRSIQDNTLQSQFFPVFYSKERWLCIDKQMIVEYWEKRTTDDVITDAKGIFLQKADYWKYEKEWRLCFMNRNPDEPREQMRDFPYVSAIYIGPRTAERDIRMVMKKVKEYEEKHNTSLRVYQMRFNDSAYDLHPHQLF